MEEALYKVTPADAAGWFDHCDYRLDVDLISEVFLRSAGGRSPSR